MKVLGTHSVLLFYFIYRRRRHPGSKILGELLSHVSFGSLMPLLSQHYEIFNIQNVNLNLYVMQIQFGIHFAPNLLSILGIILAFLIFRRL